MPDFNFAKGNSKRDESASSASSAQQSTGQQRPVSAHTQGSNSEAMNAAPERTARAANAAAGQNPKAPHPAQRSVLDKYPERDLSRLAGADDASASADAAQTDVPQSAATVSSAEIDSTAASDQATGESTTGAANTAAEGKVSTATSKGPIIAFASIILLLILLAFIWHINPWPSLKESIADVFRSPVPETVQTGVEPASPPQDAEDLSAVPAMRAWDYFLQVSSWKDLSQADLDAERYRAQNFDVIVESEFIKKKGGTWYRVRLGPFESGTEAKDVLRNNAAILPKGAYVDSERLAQDQPLISAAEPVTKSVPSRQTSQTSAASSDVQRASGKDFEVIDEPMSGWAVKVSSLKTENLARQEARKILAQGYPSFITKKNIGGTLWFRVLVGPFSDKRDADRYQQLLNVTYGNDAYTVDLSAE